MRDIEFLEADARYWRDRATAAERALTQLASDATQARYAAPLAPEPPVGTELRDPTGQVLFHRAVDGWHCAAGANCRNCPVDWAEADDWLGDKELVRVLPGDLA